MAQFGGILPGFADENENPRAVDPETPAGRKPSDYDPPNTGGHSQTEAVRLARRGGSVAPVITDPDEKREWIPGVNAADVAQLARQDAEHAVARDNNDPAGGKSELQIRNDGRRARDRGQPISDCPHQPHTQVHYQWVSGWMQPRATDPEDAS